MEEARERLSLSFSFSLIFLMQFHMNLALKQQKINYQIIRDYFDFLLIIIKS